MTIVEPLAILETKTVWDPCNGYVSGQLEHAFVPTYQRYEEYLQPLLKDRESVTILDVAANAGEPSLRLAAALPQAHVVVTDVAETAVDLAKLRATRAGLTNLTFEVADAEALTQYTDGQFDVVCCSYGLMFMDIDKAMAEFFRVLKPGGIAVITVWGCLWEVDFFRIGFATLGELVGADYPKPFNPNNLGEPWGLMAATRTVGFENVALERVAYTMSDVETYGCIAFFEGTPTKHVIEKLCEEGQHDIWERVSNEYIKMAQKMGFATAGDASITLPYNLFNFMTATKPAL